jgi:hypothetical protein
MSEHATGPGTEVRAVVERGLAHLLSIILRNGRFVYAHPLDAPDRPQDGYNMLRHCGTLWFMLRAVNELDLALAEDDLRRIEAAVGYAGGKLQAPAWVQGDTLALVTKGAIKTGGIGLALVMLEEYRKALPRGLSPVVMPHPIEATIAALQAYALAQIDGHDFLHKRALADGEVLPFRSDYYTGEVMLGLFVTGCRDPRLLATAEALMARRYGVSEQSHWMAYAACEAAERGLVGEERLIGYLTDLVVEIIGNDGYRARRQSTPIACRTEALTRFALLCDRWPGRFPADLCSAALRAAEENMALQLGWFRDGQFWKGDGDDKVQIDYIQHNATAFLNRLLRA